MAGVNVTDYVTMDVEATAKNISSEASDTLKSNTKGMVLTVEGSAVRMREDGTDPTATEGHLINPGDVVTYDSWTVPKQDWKSTIRNLNFIAAVAATTGNIKVTYYD